MIVVVVAAVAGAVVVAVACFLAISVLGPARMPQSRPGRRLAK